MDLKTKIAFLVIIITNYPQVNVHKPSKGKMKLKMKKNLMVKKKLEIVMANKLEMKKNQKNPILV